MFRWQGYGAAVAVTGQFLVIERRGLSARVAGAREVIPFGDVVGFHVREPSMVTNGWIQLCVGDLRPALGRTAAPSDPHTVSFRRHQRDQMAALRRYLQQLVDVNRHRVAERVHGENSKVPTWEPRARVQVSGGPSFVGFDVETANSSRGSICAIGLTVVVGGRVTATHSWLCRPPAGFERFDAGNVRVHGITPNDVAGQPSFRRRLGDLLDIVGDLPLVAHNAAFDIGALREASIAEAVTWRPLDFGCTLIWARNELPDLINHKLPTVARALGVDLSRHHEASADATAAAEIALEFMRRRGVSTVEAYASATGITLGRATVDGAVGPRRPGRSVPSRVTSWSTATPPPPNPDADPHHPLCGQTVVLTGSLSGLSREEAWSQLAKHGARVNKTVTRRTTVLVVGSWVDEQGRPRTTEKEGEARRLRGAGQDIAIIDQRQVEALLTGDRSVPLPDLQSKPTVDAYALADDSGLPADVRRNTSEHVRGKNFIAWVEPIKQLKRDDRLDEALELLLECIDVAERPGAFGGGMPAPWYTEQAAIVYRKQKNYAAEVAVLQRWIDSARRNGVDADDTHPLVQRKAKAQALLDKSTR